jgi:hypothetical protein
MDSIILLPMLIPVAMGSIMAYIYLPMIVTELKKQNERLGVIAEQLDEAKRSNN